MFCVDGWLFGCIPWFISIGFFKGLRESLKTITSLNILPYRVHYWLSGISSFCGYYLETLRVFYIGFLCLGRHSNWMEVLKKMSMFMTFLASERNMLIVSFLKSLCILVAQEFGIWQGLGDIHVNKDLGIGGLSPLFGYFKYFDKISLEHSQCPQGFQVPKTHATVSTNRSIPRQL